MTYVSREGCLGLLYWIVSYKLGPTELMWCRRHWLLIIARPFDMAL